jgi:PAS domain S-box-containing protein
MKGLKHFKFIPTIGTKFIAVFILVVALISIFIYIYFPLKLEQQAIRFIADKARSIMDMTAFNIASTLVFEDKQDMENIFRSVRQAEDILYLVVHNQKGEVFGAFNHQAAVDAGYRFLSSHQPITNDGLIYRVMTPIFYKKKKIGELFLGISLKNLHYEVEKSKKAITLVSSIIFILGVLAVFLFSVVITRPLKKMVRTIEEISRGDMSQRVPFLSRDEVGQLAVSFNLMVENLETYSRELKELNINLENKVRERTQELQLEVNERKSAQEALEESEEKYKRLVDNSLVGIYITQKQVIKFCNRQFAEIFAYRGIAEVTGRPMPEFLTAESRAALDRMKDQDAGQARIAHRYELKGVKKDGIIFDIEVLETPIIFRDQPAVQGILMDITLRKQMEEERQKLENQLRQSQKMESLGTLAGGIAHDFNNILMAIMGYTELTLMSLTEKSKESANLKRVLAASNRAKELVKQILTFSRKNEIERKPIWLNEAVKEALHLMRSILPTFIEIRQDIPEMSRPVLADRAEIHQVVMNLCTNAGHAMSERGGILHVSLKEIQYKAGTISRTRLFPGRYQQLTISDTGHGMSREILNRIFEPYFTTKREGEGTGMGLAVVHGIIKSYGGNISIYSEPAKGSTFHIFLPSPSETELDVDVEPKIQESKTELRGNERILFVDDEPVLADLGKATLESLGYRVEMRTSSIDALQAFRADPGWFDLVITDQSMPHMTGTQLAAAIKEIKPGIPVILCSGFSKSIAEESSKLQGIQAFLMKPILKQEIAAAIRRVLA